LGTTIRREAFVPRRSQRTDECVDAYIKLTRAAESVVNRVSRSHLKYNLTVSQFGVLEALLHLGPMSQKDLSAKILKSHGNLSVVVDNLEKRQLVTRTRNTENDRRIVIVALTPEGESLVKSVLPETRKRIEQEFRALSSEQLAQLGATCKVLGLGDSVDAVEA
jgi:MarR family 2-MHQ and catechol resistance regulon transcriptional repressor